MKLLRWLGGHFEELLMMIALSSITVIMFMQVVMRYVFRSSLAWSEELSRYFFIWMTFLGISYAIKKRTHLRIDLLETFIPALKKPLEYLTDVVFVAFSIFMLPPAATTLRALWQSGQTSPAMEIPMFVVYLSLVLAYILILIRVAEKYIRKITNREEEIVKKVI